MPRTRILRVVSHGDGIRVKKAVDLAIKSRRAGRASIEITAVEKAHTKHVET